LARATGDTRVPMAGQRAAEAGHAPEAVVNTDPIGRHHPGALIRAALAMGVRYSQAILGARVVPAVPERGYRCVPPIHRRATMIIERQQLASPTRAAHLPLQGHARGRVEAVTTAPTSRSVG